MSQKHVLVIEDDPDIQELIRYNLLKEGYKVTCSDTGEKGLEMAVKNKPDLVVLDLMLPGIDGLDVCRELKSDDSTRDMSVIMVTAKGEESDIVIGLELGADDYIVKPFSPRVLLSRIRAVLRRRKPSVNQQAKTAEIIEIDGIKLHMGKHEVSVNGETVDLTATEFKLLNYLAQRPGWVFTRQQIIDAVRGENVIITDRAVDVQVVGLRKKLGDSGKLIETVRGVGYRFVES